MKRFVTYLYECERGNKIKNTGFIRVVAKEEETVMEVYIRNYLRNDCIGKLFALISRENLWGIQLGEVNIHDAQGDEKIVIQTKDIHGSGFSIHEIEGIGIHLDDGGYIASCWRDEYVDEILRGEFRTQEDISEEEKSAREDREEKAFMENSSWEKPEDLEMGLEAAEEAKIQAIVPHKTIAYEKINHSQIRDLPSPNWHLSNNSFLVHGFRNYGYLVLKKEMEEDKEKLSLGVPGIFEKPEVVMAILFGFPTFEEIPPEVVDTDMNRPADFSLKEKNQEPKVGTFGCWFVTLQV